MHPKFQSPTAPPRTAIEEEVASRFGFVPNFFRSASTAPAVIDDLWAFARSAYLDNPLPSIFKERLFVHLSRYCSVRYCIVRHVGFLIGHGRPSGDANAWIHTPDQVVDLLRRPGAADDAVARAALKRLEEKGIAGVPEADTPEESDIFIAASLLFLEPARSEAARQALQTALGSESLELLLAFLAFVRMAHFWTLTHPDLAIEEDMNSLLQRHETLSSLLLNATEGEQCEIGARLFDELVALRREREDRQALRQALADREVLINELNHRVKNTLTVIQSIAAQTLRGSEVPASVRDALNGRLIALASAHDLLTLSNWATSNIRTILERALAYFSASDTMRISLDGPDLAVTPAQSVSLALAIHELAANAARHGALSSPSGRVGVDWERDRDENRFVMRWRESGGPPVRPPAQEGFGSRLLQRVVASDLDGDVALRFEPAGLNCVIRGRLAVQDNGS